MSIASSSIGWYCQPDVEGMSCCMDTLASRSGSLSMLGLTAGTSRSNENQNRSLQTCLLYVVVSGMVGQVVS